MSNEVKVITMPKWDYNPWRKSTKKTIDDCYAYLVMHGISQVEAFNLINSITMAMKEEFVE